MRKFYFNPFLSVPVFVITAVAFIAFSITAIASSSNTTVNSEYETEADLDDSEFIETVKMTTNLLADAKLAQAKQIPILLLFTQQSCGFCEIVRSDFLRPMLLNEEYDSRVLIRQIEIDGDDVVGFDGKTVSMDSFTDHYNVGFTPTVIFLDSNGKELTEQLIGLTTVHYYGGFLDDNIDLAIEKIRSKQDSNDLAKK
ncbi:MAG: thioredoxin family protein [Gammaproteobacteria bacterium]